MKLAVFLAVVAALASCRKGSSSSAPPPRTGDGPYDERQACTADGDCVPVEIECCDHCNGGTVIGVHRDHAGEVRRTYAGPDECGEIMCTQMACVEDPAGICRQGVCGIKIGTREDVPALPAP
jgi:hypothetical protein